MEDIGREGKGLLQGPCAREDLSAQGPRVQLRPWTKLQKGSLVSNVLLTQPQVGSGRLRAKHQREGDSTPKCRKENFLTLLCTQKHQNCGSRLEWRVVKPEWACP